MTYQSEVLADSPLLYWKLDERGLTDAQGGPDWIVGTGAVGGRPGLVADGGTAYRGGGADAIGRLTAFPTNLAGSSVSFSAWVNIPSTDVAGPFFTIGARTANGWGVGIGGTSFDSVGKQLILLQEGIAWKTTGYTFAPGKHHVAVTRSSADLFTAYVDGVSVWSGTFTPKAPSGGMALGGSSDTARALSSTVDMDDAAWFTSVLSPATVTAIYNAGSGSPSATESAAPAIWLKLNDTATASAVAADASGNGRSGTHVAPLSIAQPSLLGDGSGASVLYAGGYTTCANAAWMNTTGVAVECRYKPRSADLSGSKPLVTRWAGSGSAWILWVNNGKVEGYVYTANGQFGPCVGATTLVAGTAYTVGMSYDGANITVYVNGSLDGTLAATGALAQPTAPIEVARVSQATLGGGTVDEVSVMPAAISSARFAARHAAAIATGPTAGTVAGTLPALSGSAAGTVTAATTGTVAGTLPPLTGSVAGTPVTTGSGDGTLPALTGTGTGTVAGLTSGIVAGTIPALSGSVAGDVTGPTTGTVAGTLPALTGGASDSTTVASIPAGTGLVVGPVTVLDLVTLAAVEIGVATGLTAGPAIPVVPLPGVSVELGASLLARPAPAALVDPRTGRAPWRYVITDLQNAPLGELVDVTAEPVEDGIGDPTTMQLTVVAGSHEAGLIKPVERQCQVWDGDQLRLRGPILPGQPSEDGATVRYTVHDPSWFIREGRRVITRIPAKNLLHNGGFRAGLSWWRRGFDADSVPTAAPTVRVVAEDFANDTDGLNPISAAEIVGTESYTASELSSNAVFWPNLATFRPGGRESIEAVADKMPTTAGLPVTVVGHTANDGTGNGLVLSRKRAEAAAAVIKARRPNVAITTKGVGFYDPKPGYPIDSQEQRRVVISYAATVTADAKQYLIQTVEVTQPKEARYPLELTLAAMLKVTDSWSTKDANMVSLKIVARRKDANPGPWDEQLGQGSASIADTDPVGRWIPQTASATVPADGRPYIVDVYLYAPAATARYTAVGLFPDEQLYFWGADQGDIFAGIWAHIQDPTMGHGPLGIAVRAPATGILRDREFAFRDLTPADTALDGLVAVSRGLEWDTVTTPTETTATAFYPRQGKTLDYVLAQGGNVVRAVPATTRDIGSNVIAQAQGLGTYRATGYARDAAVFGGTLIERVITAEQDTPLNELGETAAAELHWARSSTPAYWVDIDPDRIEEVLAATGKGDTVRLILDDPDQVDALARIVRRQIGPDSLRLMLAFEQA